MNGGLAMKPRTIFVTPSWNKRELVITCTCGWREKAWAADAYRTAVTHNNNHHGGKYRITPSPH